MEDRVRPQPLKKIVRDLPPEESPLPATAFKLAGFALRIPTGRERPELQASEGSACPSLG